MNILIVEHVEEKVKAIMNDVILPLGIKESSVEVAIDQISCREQLFQKKFDVLLLDINFSERFGDKISKTNAGIEILSELDRSTDIIKPTYIIGLTQHEELFKEYKTYFDERLFPLVKYQSKANDWKDKLTCFLTYILSARKEGVLNSVTTRNYKTDIAIITALQDPEFINVMNLPGNWTKKKIQGDDTIYQKGTFKRERGDLSVIAACCDQMGVAAATNLSTKIIIHFRPRYLIMCGIAAGTSKKADFGDILIANNSFDYGSGKIVTAKNGKGHDFLPDPKNIGLDTSSGAILSEIKRENLFLNEIKNSWPGTPPSSSLQMFIGPFATGSAVVDNTSVIEDIKVHQRKLIGLDMESYGVFYAAKYSGEPKPNALSIKSISDFAHRKKDRFQKYAAFTSAQFAYKFSLECL